MSPKGHVCAEDDSRVTIGLQGSLDIVADAVLPLRRARKRQEPERQERQPVPAAAYDDAIPF